MPKILAPVEHLVVVMLENRSLDNMLRTLYADKAGLSIVLFPRSASGFDGLRPEFTNPSSAAYFSGARPPSVPVMTAVRSSTVPDADPEGVFVCEGDRRHVRMTPC